MWDVCSFDHGSVGSVKMLFTLHLFLSRVLFFRKGGCEVSGSSARNVAKQLQDQQMMFKGCWETSPLHVLEMSDKEVHAHLSHPHPPTHPTPHPPKPTHSCTHRTNRSHTRTPLTHTPTPYTHREMVLLGSGAYSSQDSRPSIMTDSPFKLKKINLVTLSSNDYHYNLA